MRPMLQLQRSVEKLCHPKPLELSDASKPYRQLIVDIAISSIQFSSTHGNILGKHTSSHATLEAFVILIISLGYIFRLCTQEFPKQFANASELSQVQQAHYPLIRDQA